MKAANVWHIQNGRFINNPEKLSRKPEGVEFRHIGLVQASIIFPDEPHIVTDDYCEVCITERVMPSKSIKLHVAEVMADHVARTGEKVTKAMKAQWAEEYLEENLPHAPLKVTLVPCYIESGFLFIGTSSAKLAEDVLAFLRGHVIEQNDDLEIKFPRTTQLNGYLADLLMGRGGETSAGNELLLGSTVKLCEPASNRKISITHDDELSQAFSVYGGNPVVTELQLGEQGNCTFNLSEKAIFKGIKLHLTAERDEELSEAKDRVIEAQTLERLNRQALNLMATVVRDFEEHGKGSATDRGDDGL